jgi:streptomycin 6-kinase
VSKRQAEGLDSVITPPPPPEFVQIPRHLRETIEGVHGETGRRWLARLPALVGDCRARWSLELGAPFDDLSYNLVIPARGAQGAEVVLKLGVPCRELVSEAAALRLFDGAGAVRLLDHVAEWGALLLERVLPGTPVHELLDDAEATRAAARLMLRLWREPPARHAFPTLPEWFRAFGRLRCNFGGGSGPFPPELVARAERAFSELNASAGRALILHGDLHHANILSAANGGWIAIDPKGLCGDPGYEVGPFMLNRLPDGASDSALLEVMRARLSVFACELGIERERLAGWAFCHAVLSALWAFEDSEEWQGTIRLARVLERLI